MTLEHNFTIAISYLSIRPSLFLWVMAFSVFIILAMIEAIIDEYRLIPATDIERNILEKSHYCVIFFWFSLYVLPFCWIGFDWYYDLQSVITLSNLLDVPIKSLFSGFYSVCSAVFCTWSCFSMIESFEVNQKEKVRIFKNSRQSNLNKLYDEKITR